MKKSLLSIIMSLYLLSAIAQPAGSVFPDFTFSDLEGTEHNLQSYLDEGKIVVIDVFATWCSNCQNSVGGLEDLYNTYGQGGDQSMVILSFERDPNTNNEAQYIEQYGVQTPVITEATELVADEWNITYQPRYFVICPDGTFQSELVTPIYNDPQPLIEMSEECEIVSGIGESDLESVFSIINTSIEDMLFYNNMTNDLEYRILDVTGSVNKIGQLPSGNGQLDLSDLRNGLYLIYVTDDRSALTKRIIKRS